MTMPEIASAPSMPMSKVLMFAIIAKPLVPPTSALKSTPNTDPHWESMVLRK